MVSTATIMPSTMIFQFTAAERKTSDVEGCFFIARNSGVSSSVRRRHEDEGNDEAADEEWNSPFGEFEPPKECNRIARHGLVEEISDDRGDEDRDLLAGGLERGVEAPVAGRRDLGEIDRDAAELDAGGKALQQAADQHDERCGDADAGIGRTDRDRHRADRHDREGDDQPLAAADPVDIGAEHDRADAGASARPARTRRRC